nr:hypothetical protein [Tanacetum cinerariifolium]
MHMVHAVVLTQSKPVSITAIRPICAAVPKIMVTRPKHAHSIDTKSKSTFRRHLTYSQTAAKALVVSAAQGMKGKWVWRPKCPILDHDSRTTSTSMTLKRLYYIDSQGKSKPICAAVPKIMVTRPKHAHSIDTMSKSTFRRHLTYSQTAAKALVVSAAQGVKGKWVWRPKCPILDHDSRTT